MKKDFLFSVIITIYDAEEFLEDAIKSVVKQTIGFKKNIQLILVNNASEDNCDIICKKYKEKYPENIEYIELKENQGASGGRNAGIPYIKGKYFNYLDADDLWQKKAFKKAYEFFKKNENEIDIVSVRRKNFGRQKGYHHTDYKFTKKNRIIDINEEYDAVQMHVTSCFFKTESCNYRKFDKKIGIGEDSEYIADLIVQKGKYGALKDNVYYYYRKREDGRSALDKKEKSNNYFLKDYPYSLERLMECSKKVYGKVIPYIQYQVAYETGWLFRSNCKVLTEEETKIVKDKAIDYLKEIDDEIILTNKVMRREHKLYALKLKHGEDYINKISLDKLKDYNLFAPKSRKNVTIKTLDIENDILKISFLTSIIPNEERWEIYLKDSEDNKYYPKRSGGNIITKSLNEDIFTRKGFFFEIDLKNLKNTSIKVVLSIDGKEYYTNFECDKWSKASNEVSGSYYYKKCGDRSYTIRYIGKKIKVNINYKKWKLEIKYLLKLLKKFKFNVIYYRIIGSVYKLSNKKIWFITDRISISDDNGEMLYKKLLESDLDKNIKPYYILERKSEDVKKVKKYGKVIYFKSFKYKRLYLKASAVISSMVDKFIYNEPFDKNDVYLRDYDAPRICVGHGVSEQDMHRTEGKFINNFKIYTVASEREQKAKTTELYGYTNDEILLTGIPRFDYIYEASKKEKGKVILIAPTWRRSLAGAYIKGERLYNPDFKDSEYFKFYNNLINDKRILKVMKEKGYTGIFNIHPMHRPNTSDFESNDIIKVQERNESYVEQFSTNRMVITDYSSIGHDYAYAESSVIYCQFDLDTFYNNHTYDEGTFDYEKDGFGPVCYDYESTVKEIIRFIENDCVVDKKYRDRTKKYFKYFDNNNCKRIKEEIEKNTFVK